MGKPTYLNGLKISGGGGSEGIHLTQAEYDALPDSKLTDGKIYYITDGISGRDIVCCGVFIDTDNLIYEGTYSYSNPLSYTATEDCIARVTMIASSNDSTNGNTELFVNNVAFCRLFNGIASSNIVTYGVVYLKKGQTLTGTTGRTSNTGVVVYGIQEGTNATYDQENVETVTFQGASGVILKRIGKKRILKFSGALGTTANNSAQTNIIDLDAKDVPDEDFYGLVVASGSASKETALVLVQKNNAKVSIYNYTGSNMSYAYGEVAYTV